jgi:hypothetical protein
MSERSPIERMETRAKAVRARALVRAWEYRQRHHAAGMWFRLRLTLVDAEEAYAISADDAALLREGGSAQAECGREMSPEKPMFFVEAEGLTRLPSRRQIPVNLGPEFLAAVAVALVKFEDATPGNRPWARRV